MTRPKIAPSMPAHELPSKTRRPNPISVRFAIGHHLDPAHAPFRIKETREINELMLTTFGIEYRVALGVSVRRRHKHNIRVVGPIGALSRAESLRDRTISLHPNKAHTLRRAKLITQKPAHREKDLRVGRQADHAKERRSQTRNENRFHLHFHTSTITPYEMERQLSDGSEHPTHTEIERVLSLARARPSEDKVSL